MGISQLKRRRIAIENARSSPLLSTSEPAVSQGIADSWQRSRSRIVAEATGSISEAEATQRWVASPINRYAGDVLDELSKLVERENFVAAFVEKTGLVTWCAGSRQLARAAERSGFVRGSNWSETTVGTNAPGTAISVGRPVSVFASEHWAPSVQDWACYATPVRDSSDRIIGALNISTDWRSESRLALATVSAMGIAVERQLAIAPVSTGSVQISALGHRRANFYGKPTRLSLRQTEILVLLGALGDASLGELHDRLHGERSVSPKTTKSEISGLRRLLGSTGIGSRPYRLSANVEIDVVDLQDALSRGDLGTASLLYGGQLLPHSESPAIIELRHHIDAGLRSALLESGSRDQLRRFYSVHPSDDQVYEAARERA